MRRKTSKVSQSFLNSSNSATLWTRGFHPLNQSRPLNASHTCSFGHLAAMDFARRVLPQPVGPANHKTSLRFGMGGSTIELYAFSICENYGALYMPSSIAFLGPYLMRYATFSLYASCVLSCFLRYSSLRIGFM